MAKMSFDKAMIRELAQILADADLTEIEVRREWQFHSRRPSGECGGHGSPGLCPGSPGRCAFSRPGRCCGGPGSRFRHARHLAHGRHGLSVP